MPYQVLALKYRPHDFDEIIGQPKVVTTLKNAIQKNKLANAYLFSGPRGIGKTSCARILAKALNCKNGPTDKPCGNCPSCVDIAFGRSLDVMEIDGASNRGIDEIRTLRENVKFAPVQGKYKVYIIDEVHQITPEGFNALLKTLEEPPEFVKFIFATTHPQKVPSTIISRCQHLDFRRISVMEIIAQLEKIVASERLKVEKEVLLAVAGSSDGSMRDAESVLDQLIAFAKDEVSLKDVISLLGLVEQETLFKITEKIINKDARGALTLLSNIIDEGKDPALFLSHLIEHFRNLMVAKVAQADTQLIDLPKEVCEKLVRQAEAFSLEEVFGIFNILVNTQEISRRLESIRLPLEITLVKLSHDKRGQPAFQAQARPPAPVIEKPKTEVLKKEEIPTTMDQPNSSVSLELVKGTWQNIIGKLKDIKMSVATYLNEGELVSIQNNTLTIAFSKNHSLHKESLEDKNNRLIIEKNIAEVLGAHLKIKFILTAEEKKKEDTKDHPFIKSALDMFNGKVVKEQ